jgi:putative PIN family toxin of toxin-antitoxin system
MIVADTNVILRGVRASEGSSGFILRGMLKGEIAFALSPAVVFEYEDVLKRPDTLGDSSKNADGDIEAILDALCARAVLVSPWFRFRPFLDDPKDDIFVECALAAGARWIVTNDKHFRKPDLRRFGVTAISAQDYVREYREKES